MAAEVVQSTLMDAMLSERLQKTLRVGSRLLAQTSGLHPGSSRLGGGGGGGISEVRTYTPFEGLISLDWKPAFNTLPRF